MASVKVVLQKAYRNKKGQTAVVVQVTHNYKTRRRTLFKIDSKYWSDGLVKKAHPDHVRLNGVIRSTLNTFEKRIVGLEEAGSPFTVDQVFIDRNDSTTLLHAVREYQARLANSDQLRSSLKVKPVADRIETYDRDVLLSSINTEWIDRFRDWVRSLDEIGSDYTLYKYVSIIKTVLRHEFANDRYHDQKAINYRVPVAKSVKERLSRDEFEAWRTADVPGHLILYRNFFTAMVYLRGMRVGDALQLKPGDVSDGRIRIVEEKTGKAQDIKIVPELQEILDRYAGQSDYYLFPLLRQAPQDPKKYRRFQKHIESKTATLNKNYKLISAYAGIKKKVTNHIARHTFASFADRSGLDSRTISKMLNHSSLKVTEGYLGELRRSDELDDAADKVFG